MSNEEFEKMFGNDPLFGTMIIIRDWVNKYYVSKEKIRKLTNYYEKKLEEFEEKEKEWKNMNEEQKIRHNFAKAMYEDYYYAYKELLKGE